MLQASRNNQAVLAKTTIFHSHNNNQSKIINQNCIVLFIKPLLDLHLRNIFILPTRTCNSRKYTKRITRKYLQGRPASGSKPTRIKGIRIIAEIGIKLNSKNSSWRATKITQLPNLPTEWSLSVLINSAMTNKIV